MPTAREGNVSRSVCQSLCTQAEGVSPLDRDPPWTETSKTEAPGKRPPGQRPPGQRPLPGGHCSDRYASSWNSFNGGIMKCIQWRYHPKCEASRNAMVSSGRCNNQSPNILKINKLKNAMNVSFKFMLVLSCCCLMNTAFF